MESPMPSLSNLKPDVKKRFERIIELFEASQMGLWEMDAQGEMTFYNEAFYEQFLIKSKGSSIDEWVRLMHPMDRQRMDQTIATHMASQQELVRTEYRILDKEGTYRWIEAHGVIHFDEAGQYTYMVGSHTDISNQKNYTELLSQLAYQDELTGLCNRKKLNVVLSEALKQGKSGTLMIINFNLYTQLISYYGHELGDRLIFGGAKLLERLFVGPFSHYRLSTFEFAIHTDLHLSNEEVTTYFNNLNQELDALMSSFGFPIDALYHTGVFRYQGHEENYEEVIHMTLLTLNEAKSNPSGRLAFYQKDIKDKVLKELHIKNKMLQAIKDKEFYAVFQPILYAKTGEVKSFEALARWKSPIWGPIFPDEFIPVAEDNGEIIVLGHEILDQACAFITAYQAKHHTYTKVSVNVSMIQLMREDYLQKVIDTLATYKMDPSSLIIEITESWKVEAAEIVLSQLHKLKALGVGISLDDFGTGYASLNNMIILPLTELKIDRAIIMKSMENDSINKFVRAVISICHDNDLLIVAEGIETDVMVKRVKALGADLLQGYYFNQPMEAKKALDYGPMHMSGTPGPS